MLFCMFRSHLSKIVAGIYLLAVGVALFFVYAFPRPETFQEHHALGIME
jgi:hypothetical protein